MGAGKTTYILSASFRDRNGYIWQANLTFLTPHIAY
jgi:hypothetical protein